MSGKPAARMGDMTQYGGPIVQGSAGVFIGAPTGVACSVCSGGMTSGNPVNPLLGAKVLPGETDIVLPGPLSFVLSRSYSSYRTKTPAPAGVFGPGWKAPFDSRLQLRDEEIILNDNGGRSIHFEHLLPGETAFSHSESFWLARGGVLNLHESNTLHPLWQTLPEDIRLSPHIYLATSSVQGPWWILGWPERVPDPDEALPAPLPSYRVLTALADNFGRTLTFHREAEGEFTGHITGVTDGAGRRFRLVLSTQKVPVSGYGADSGVRLRSVWLTRDPVYPNNLPATPLVRYDYTPRGELAAVYDRSGTQVRSFEYDEKYPGRMVAHRYAGRSKIRYRYDAAGRVTEQYNAAGLSYCYGYARNRVVITDSLNRRTVLHTEGEGGLKRVVREEQADGSTITREFNPAGWLTVQTDAAGSRTEYRRSPASGSLTAQVAPDGRVTEFYYNNRRQLTDTVWPDGLTERRKYDESGRLTAETSRSGDITRWVYDSTHSEYTCATEDATGSTKQMVWSRYGQLLMFTDCSGYETRYEYDRFGQMTAIHHEEGLSEYRVYDARGRLIRQRNAQGQDTRFEYNVAGDLTAVIYPDGNKQTTEYDAAGHPVSSTQAGLTRRMDYDRAGRVTQLTNENGAVTTFTYDALNRLIQECGFDGRTQRYHHSTTGQLIRSEDENLVTGWHYDSAGRLTHRTVNNTEAERWHYNEHGWLSEVSHLSDGHRVSVHYGYDDKGRLISEQQTVHHPESGKLLWQHEMKHDYHAGLKKSTTPDLLPPAEWLTYGSGYLAGMKLGDTPLLDFSRDRLHRETQRNFFGHELTTLWTPAGQLHSHHLNSLQFTRDYTWNEAGQLIRISGRQEQRSYQYSDSGRLVSTQRGNDTHWTLTDPAGNRIAERDKYSLLPQVWRDNRITQDADFFYHYDKHGRLTEKDERRIREGGSHVHHYGYDHQHRLTHFRLMQNGDTLTECRYGYDPLGRRISKRVWKSQTERDSNGENYLWLPSEPEVTWYGWDGDHLTTTQTDATRIQTLYLPGSFTPLIRTETATTELAKGMRRTLAEKLQQDAGVMFVPELVTMLNNLEDELQRGEISASSQAWLKQCGLTPEQLENQIEPVYTPLRKIHLYHCDHRGLPLALFSPDGSIAWHADFDEWGVLLKEDNPQNLQQLIRLPGQQYDEETGLHYNRYRYYDPHQGRYITQDPIGLRGGWNSYAYPLSPIRFIDPLGLAQICSRPLKGARGLRTNGITGLDLGLFHAHIFFDDGTNIGYGGDSGLFSEPKTNDYTCNKEKYDDEAMKKAVKVVKNEPDNLLFPDKGKQYGNDNYSFIINNCQDFVSEVLDEYKKIKGTNQ